MALPAKLPTDAELLASNLEPFVRREILLFLTEDPLRVERGGILLQALRTDPENKLGIRSTDLFRNDHLAVDAIPAIARQKHTELADAVRKHLIDCTVCRAFVRLELTRVSLGRDLQPDLTASEALTPRPLTDNDPAFGKPRD